MYKKVYLKKKVGEKKYAVKSEKRRRKWGEEKSVVKGGGDEANILFDIDNAINMEN